MDALVLDQCAEIAVRATFTMISMAGSSNNPKDILTKPHGRLSWLIGFGRSVYWAEGVIKMWSTYNAEERRSRAPASTSKPCRGLQESCIFE